MKALIILTEKNIMVGEFFLPIIFFFCVMKLFDGELRLINAKGDRALKTKDAVISEILTTNYAMFYRIAFSYVHSEADAQDIVQESAYKAIFHAEKLKKTEFARTWVCRIVINEAVSFLRKRKKEISEPMDRDIPVQAAEDMTDLHKAVDNLKPEERSVIILRYFEEMKLEEIAEVCGESLSTVKSRLYRTLKKLKLDLEE